ncbi:hypothetical protein ACP70R_003111 [Stipagrostis hirtigluma subsp. patula]
MPTPKTVWTCSPDTEQGTHVFDILGYSKHRGMGVGKLIRSAKFSIGGHQWMIVFYPDGNSNAVYPDHATVGLYCYPGFGAANVRASYELSLLNRSTGSPFTLCKGASQVFGAENGRTGILFKLKRSDLESSTFLQDDRITMEWSITVFKKPRVTETRLFPETDVPPSDIAVHFGKLLETKEGVDVSFSVGAETFAAHKIVLATRSPVFKAQLFGPLREGGTEPITIKDVQPDIFRALLHFIYTDSLPPLDDLEEDHHDDVIRLLLVAADRYAMERLKLICQSILCKSLNVQTMATTMALADQHNCDMLKDACIEFMAHSNSLDALVATQGYKNLKRTCPSAVIDALEKTCRFRKA